MESFLRAIAESWRPHPGQLDFLLCDAKVRVLACGRRWGKTEACAAAIVGELLDKQPSHHLILAPTLDQAKLLFQRVDSLLYEVLGHPEDLPYDLRRSPFPKLTYGDSTVVARSGHVGRTLRGNQATHVVVDEAAFVPEELIAEVAMPMLATNNGRLTLISTPSGLNHFWKFFRMGEDREHGVWSRTAPSSESPYVSAEFLQVQRQLISERAFEVEYEAKFVDAQDAVFLSETIDACVVPEPPINLNPGSIGIDWARYFDFTAVAVLGQGEDAAHLVELRQFNRQSWPDMVAEAAEIARRHPNAVVAADGTGTGDPVTGMLLDLLPGRVVKSIRFDASTKRDLIEGLRMRLERRQISLPSHPELIKQLKHFRTTVSAAGNRRMNAPSGYHDDLVIALALAAYGLPATYRAPIKLGEVRQFAFRGKLRFEDLVWD
jgi:phage FluMu gp28-like protein